MLVVIVFLLFQDQEAFNLIRKENPRIDHIAFCDYPQLINQLRDFEFIITDRYHATIFAVLAETPFITIDSNTFKTRGLMDLFEYPIEVMTNTADFETMTQKIDQVQKNKAELRLALRKARSQMVTFAKSSYKSFFQSLVSASTQ